MENKEVKKVIKKELELKSGNSNYIQQNLEFMKFIQANKCKTREVKYGKK